MRVSVHFCLAENVVVVVVGAGVVTLLLKAATVFNTPYYSVVAVLAPVLVDSTANVSLCPRRLPCPRTKLVIKNEGKQAVLLVSTTKKANLEASTSRSVEMVGGRIVVRIGTSFMLVQFCCS
jgi:hypothetical protein